MTQSLKIWVLWILLVSASCSAVKENSSVVITNEYQSDCYATQAGRGSRDAGFTKRGEPCHSFPGLGMIPVFKYKW